MNKFKPGMLVKPCTSLYMFKPVKRKSPLREFSEKLTLSSTTCIVLDHYEFTGMAITSRDDTLYLTLANGQLGLICESLIEAID